MANINESSSYTGNHTFAHSAIGDQMVANIADTSEIARWLHTVTSAVSGWACCSNAVWSTFIYICTQQTSATHSYQFFLW